MTALAIIAAVYVTLVTLPLLLATRKGPPGTSAVRVLLSAANAGLVALLIVVAVKL